LFSSVSDTFSLFFCNHTTIITIFYVVQVLSGYLMPTTEGTSSATAVAFRIHFLKANGHRFWIFTYLFILLIICLFVVSFVFAA
jgi:hypothetical protein